MIDIFLFKMSCLFQSLSSFVSHQDYSKLRQDICDFLEQNPKILGDLDLKTIMDTENITLENYIRHMRNNATWGGAIEIRAFCEMYGVNVLVKNIRNNVIDKEAPKDIQFLTSQDVNKWIIISWNGGHYEPIVVKLEHT